MNKKNKKNEFKRNSPTKSGIAGIAQEKNKTLTRSQFYCNGLYFSMGFNLALRGVAKLKINPGSLKFVPH